LRAPAIPAVVLAALLPACAVGPEYSRPKVDLPGEWKVEAPWREARPGDGRIKGEWWRAFNDPLLDTLVAQALAQSPNLALASARLAQARATLSAASAGRYPQLSLGLRDTRLRISEERPLSNYNSTQFATVQNDFVGTLNAAYEVDLIGRVQRSIEGARAGAERSEADLENTRLLLTADVATAYFNVRQVDIELDVLARALGLQHRSLELANSRHDLGASSGLEVAQQQALLDSTLTQVDVLNRQRGQFEHALATLTGTPAPSFALAPAAVRQAPPAIPLGVPSDILERRPDVAAAERAMAAANAQIGVTRAALYPSINLGASLGGESRELSALFNAPALLWSIGASLAQPIFDGGRLRANVAFAQAGYQAELASYRRVLLTAMQEVEDGITGLAALERASRQAAAAVASASRVLEMATARYEGGAAVYLEVITAQQALLNNERLLAQLEGQRLLTAVFLVKALGGGWQAP